MHFLQVAENRENDCLCFQLCFTELKDYKGRSKRLFELILAFQDGLACVILGCFEKFLDDPYYEPLPWFMIKIGD